MIKNSLKDVEMPDVISPSGNGLSVLIHSNYNHHANWMAYASWYSIYKTLPEAKVAIAVGRASSIQHYYYHWVYRCGDLRYLLHKNIGEKMGLPYLNKIYSTYVALKEGLVKQPLVVIDYETMAVNDLSMDVVSKLNKVDFASSKSCDEVPLGSIWYFNRQPLEKLAEVINTIRTLRGRENLDRLALSKVYGTSVIDDLGNDVKEHGLTVFANYGNGCGNFTKKDWEKGKTVPPFDVAFALHSSEPTVNEKRILSLWSQMGGLWNTVNHIKV